MHFGHFLSISLKHFMEAIYPFKFNIILYYNNIYYILYIKTFGVSS